MAEASSAPRRRRLVVAGVALAGAATALVVGLVNASGTRPPSGAAKVVDGQPAPPGLYVARDHLLGASGGTRHLGAEASAPLVGGEGPVADVSPDGRFIAYNTWTWSRPIDWSRSLAQQGIDRGDTLGAPTLRLHDLETGSDTMLERGALTIAWRADGAFAYVRGAPAEYRAGIPYATDVVVRTSVRGRGAVWTPAPDRYLVYGWAGDRLIAVRGHDDGAHDVVAFDGPGAPRVLATDAGLVALGPAGDSILVTQGEPGAAVVRLIRVADGSEAAALSLSSILDPATGEPLRWLGGPASWIGDLVVASTNAGLLVIRAQPSGLKAEQVIHLDMDMLTAGTLYEPRFVGSDAGTIVAWADTPDAGGERRAAQIVCERGTLTCARGTPVPAAAVPRPVYDMSGGR